MAVPATPPKPRAAATSAMTRKTIAQRIMSDLPGLAVGVADRVLHAAGGVLHLALDLVGLAFGLQLRVAGDLAGRFLDLALRLIEGAFDPIVVHVRLPSFRCGKNGLGLRKVPSRAG